MRLCVALYFITLNKSKQWDIWSVHTCITHSPPLFPPPAPCTTTTTTAATTTTTTTTTTTATTCMSTVVFCEKLFSTYLIRLLDLVCPRTDTKVIDSKYLLHVDGKRSAAILKQNKMSGIMKKILREVTKPNKIVLLGALYTKFSSKQNVGNPYIKRGVYGRDT